MGRGIYDQIFTSSRLSGKNETVLPEKRKQSCAYIYRETK